MWASVGRDVTRTLGETPQHPGRGETVILRRPGSLEDVAGDETPALLLAAAPAVATTTALALRLPSAGKLKGTLPQGARLTLGGHVYLVGADATAAPGDTSIAVTLGSALLADVAEGDAVDVEPDAVFQLTDCHIHRKMRKDLARPLHEDFLAQITAPVAGQPTTPRLNDQLQLEDGTIGRLAGVPITTGAFWRLQMGGR